jgi:hypothetical protein
MEYRIYTLGPDEHFTGCESFVCQDDGEAVAKARSLQTATILRFGVEIGLFRG